MAICAIALLQPDGSYLLALDPAATDLHTCSYVVQSGAELGNSIFSLSVEEGSLISAGIVSCWAVAWGIKLILNLLKGSSHG